MPTLITVDGRDYTVRKHGLRYRCEIRIGGKKRHVSEVSVNALEAKVRAELTARDRAVDAAGRTGVVTVETLCRAWLAYRAPDLAPGTLENYATMVRCHIWPRIGARDANALLPMDLGLFYRSLRWHAARDSRTVLRQAFQWGIENRQLVRADNPCLVAKPSRKTSVGYDELMEFDGEDGISDEDLYQPAELRMLLRDAQERGDDHWYLWLRLATTLGTRPGETCALQRMWIDEQTGVIRICRSADKVSKRLKGPKMRWSVRDLRVGRGFIREIAPLMPSDPEAFLFPSNRRPGSVSEMPCWNTRTVKRKLEAACARVGIRYRKPHSIRHFVATRLLDQGWTPTQVAR